MTTGLRLADVWHEVRDARALRRAGDEEPASLAVRAARLARRSIGTSSTTQLPRWDELGIEVEPRNLVTSGMLIKGSDPIRIWVNRNENERRRRFTVAHEIGHYVLDDVLAGVADDVREDACDAFASELLVPRSHLAAALGGRAAIPSAAEIVRLANDAHVNFLPVLRQLQHIVRARPGFATVLSRPSAEAELQVDETAAGFGLGRPFKGQHLSKLGDFGVIDPRQQRRFDGVARVACRFRLGTWAAPDSPRSGDVAGTASWDALSLGGGNRLILCVRFLHVERLAYSERNKRHRSVQRSR